MEYRFHLGGAGFGWLASDESLFTWSNTIWARVVLIVGCLYAARRGNPPTKRAAAWLMIVISLAGQKALAS
jgi:hypothetical protein